MIDFLLSAKRDKRAAKRFFRQALARENTRNPRTVVTDRLKSYPGALREMKREEGRAGAVVRHRRGRWLNNPVRAGPPARQAPEAEPMLGFQGFRTARRTLAGGQTMAMLAKGQVRAVPTNDLPAQPGLRPSGLRPRRLTGTERSASSPTTTQQIPAQSSLARSPWQ